MSAGEKLYCTFIDYEKAFDKVNRSFLWQILENVSSKFVNALRSMYSIVRSYVRFQATKSQSRFFTSFNGLKQGDPSSPLLFMLSINDILQNINVGLEKIFTVDDMQFF